MKTPLWSINIYYSKKNYTETKRETVSSGLYHCQEGHRVDSIPCSKKLEWIKGSR
jgi:hypothetical protein